LVCLFFGHVFVFVSFRPRVCLCLFFGHVFAFASFSPSVWFVSFFATCLSLSLFSPYVCRFRDKDKHLVKKETKCVSDLLQVGGFLRVLRFSPSIKLAFTTWPNYC
jgi:hypothetical protein